jgi:hypothetical protein
MSAMPNDQDLDLEILIEELETRIAPDATDAVVPYPTPHHHQH